MAQLQAEGAYEALRQRRKRKLRGRRCVAAILLLLLLVICACQHDLGGQPLIVGRAAGLGRLLSGQAQADQAGLPWNLQLVNPWTPLPAQADLQLATLDNGLQVDARIEPALRDLLAAARQAGLAPIVVEGYRTAEQQQALLDDKIAACRDDGLSRAEAEEVAAAYVAAPGHSEHQLGLAVDLNNEGGEEQDLYDWLAAHAWEYGFIQRYPEAAYDQTGIAWEPWHYRYVGPEAAAQITSQGLCLEEYLAQIQ